MLRGVLVKRAIPLMGRLGVDESVAADLAGFATDEVLPVLVIMIATFSLFSFISNCPRTPGETSERMRQIGLLHLSQDMLAATFGWKVQDIC